MTTQRPQGQVPPRRPFRTNTPSRPVPPAIFIAPAFREDRDPRDREERPVPPRTSRHDEKTLRMTKSAAEAARRAGLDDDAVRRVMSEPSEIAPDRDHPDRTRFTRGPVVVVVARDGVVLGVYKR